MFEKCRHMGDLPFDVVIKILAMLDLSFLRTAQLVCKTFRKASIPRISCLRCNCLRSHVMPQELAHGLSEFSSVSELHLSLAVPRDASVLLLPAGLSTLRSLIATFTDDKAAASHSWEDIVPSLARATQLTALTIDHVAPHSAGFKLAASLSSFTTLEKLDLHAIPNGEGQSLAEVVLELPRLERLGCWAEHDGGFMETVVCNASRMTRLQSLDLQAGQWSGTVGLEQLATLTQLTSLCFGERVLCTSSQLLQLSCLTSVQVLRLGMSLGMGELFQLASPMTKLRELQFRSLSRDDDATVGLDPLLAHLPTITKLDLMSPLLIRSRLPGSLLPNGFACLRAVALELRAFDPSGIVQLAKAFTGLESLKLICPRAKAHAFLSHLPCLGKLTELDLERTTWSKGDECTSLGFLAEIQNLKRLALDNILDGRIWGDGVRFIATLTGLTELRIRCCCWLVERLTSAQVQPLTTLVRLKRLVSNKPWGAAFDSSDFRAALHGRQHDMGLPHTDIICPRDI
jgi:hypothetical protein